MGRLLRKLFKAAEDHLVGPQQPAVQPAASSDPTKETEYTKDHEAQKDMPPGGESIIFIILCGTGVFPASVDEMKAADIYVPYMVKYGLYILAGLVVPLGVFMVYGAFNRGSSPALGTLVLWFGASVTLGTIGLTIYLFTKDADIDADWWSYLIQALILVQRIALLLAIIAALVAVHEAQGDEAARQALLEGRY
ncbi:hypothetical protein N2152v2_003464 [Parachlorella kessleri]